MVSGYLYKPGRSYGENVVHKAKRLLVPYFGYSALLLVFYRAIGRTWQETGRSALGVLYSRYCLLIRRHIRTTYFYLPWQTVPCGI